MIVHLARREPREVCRIFDELAASATRTGSRRNCNGPRRSAAGRSSSWATSSAGCARSRRAWTPTPYALGAAPPVLPGALAGALLRADARPAPRRLDDRRASPSHRPAFLRRGARAAAGRVLGARRRGDEAEAEYREALARRSAGRAVARAAGRARLRVLPVEHGRTAEARASCSILSWFTEGRETLDFVYAEGLLRTLD